MIFHLLLCYDLDVSYVRFSEDYLDFRVDIDRYLFLNVPFAHWWIGIREFFSLGSYQYISRSLW